MNGFATRQLHRAQRGFTLIEVMIVVAIIAILAAVAIPSYSDYVRRGKLPEAFSGLSDYKVKMEQYYQDNRSYGAATCADTNVPPWGPFPVVQKNFTFSCAVTAGGQGFTLTADGTASSAIGHTYTLDNGNVKSTTKFKGVAVTQPGWCVSAASNC